MLDPNVFKTLASEAKAALAVARSSVDLERIRVAYLGRQGKLTMALRDLKTLDPESRKAAGQAGNEAKAALEAALTEVITRLTATDGDTTPVDISLPGKVPQLGHRHPVTLVLEQIEEVFTSLGFSLADGPEIEDDWHNFEALNIGPDHPGRDMQDTFYVAGSENQQGIFGLLPRTQTTAVTARELERLEPPLRMFTLGKVFRNEVEDATHGAVFHQLDGVMVDEHVTFADLKGVMTEGLRLLLGDEIKIRFRPSYFPFTEPSAEVDISMPSVRNGEWLELAGAGMLHPNVLRNVGYDPKRFKSFAFAWGVERIAMLKYGIQDLRGFTHPDIRILEQF